MEQKLDAELSLSLSLSEEERMKDPVLRAGYEPATRIWTLILLYQGSLTEIQDNLSVSIIPLLGSFAIFRQKRSPLCFSTRRFSIWNCRDLFMKMKSPESPLPAWQAPRFFRTA